MSRGQRHRPRARWLAPLVLWACAPSAPPPAPPPPPPLPPLPAMQQRAVQPQRVETPEPGVPDERPLPTGPEAPWGPVVFYTVPVNVDEASEALIRVQFGVGPEIARLLLRARTR